jgi:hypothetical protein
MIYGGLVKTRVSPHGEIDLIGVDEKTFIATFGYGDEAKELAQYVATLWNMQKKSEGLTA